MRNQLVQVNLECVTRAFKTRRRRRRRLRSRKERIAVSDVITFKDGNVYLAWGGAFSYMNFLIFMKGKKEFYFSSMVSETQHFTCACILTVFTEDLSSLTLELVGSLYHSGRTIFGTSSQTVTTCLIKDAYSREGFGKTFPFAGPSQPYAEVRTWRVSVAGRRVDLVQPVTDGRAEPGRLLERFSGVPCGRHTLSHRRAGKRKSQDPLRQKMLRSIFRC